MFKNQVKIISVIAIALFGFFLFSQDLEANSMSSIDYSIELQSDGSGIVTETRQMHLTEGTEVYLVFSDLEGSEITDVHVSDFGESFTYQDQWDINASREEKTGKYGLIPTSEGYELTWGIGEYGDHEFIVSYTLSGMVRQLEDGQSLLWRFFNGRNNVPPEEVTITISGAVPFDQEQTKIWSFGYDGEVYLEDGQLIGWSNQALTERDYITIFMQFLDQPFSPALTWGETIAEQEAKAMESSNYLDQGRSDSDQIAMYLGIVIAGLAIITAFFSGFYVTRRRKAIEAADPLITGSKRELLNEGKTYHQIPYPVEDIADVAYFLQEQGKGELEAYFNAFLLKWLRDGQITQIKDHSNQEEIIKLNVRTLGDESTLEAQFYQMLLSAADRHGEVDAKQLTSWAEENYDQITEIEASLPYESKQFLLKENYLNEEEVYFLGNFRAKALKSTFKGEELYNQLVQFENYLNELLLLDESELKHLSLSEDVIIWASLFNLVEPIVEQIEAIDQIYFTNHHFTFTNIYWLSLYSSGFSSGYDRAVTSHQRSSGGGGTTSFGGGGGSFGGGGGGVR
ncbi:MAG TPA: DUF2207 domain-containing protein [Bacilli bacterium]|nr:DUF2207 domain-containing protein [Bacilli bacterium]